MSQHSSSIGDESDVEQFQSRKEHTTDHDQPKRDRAESVLTHIRDNKEAKQHFSAVFKEQQASTTNLRSKKLKDLFPPPQHPVLLEWKNLGYTITTKAKQKKQSAKNEFDVESGEQPKKSKLKTFFSKENHKRHILSNLNGSVAPGEFLAILGPSGAGKTTLLNILAGRVKKGVSGDILVNGQPRNKTAIKKHSAFVMQDDIFFSQLTVTETLHLTARLILPKSLSVKEKIQRAEDLIDMFKIRKCAHTIAGSPMRRGLSGGEKKRLNIANELIGNATVVVMDEPTSGLDASTALLVVSMLAQLAKSGKTVIATLHQPSSQMFEMFDKVLLLADGKTAFLGTPSDALDYFSGLGLDCPARYNPADFLLSLIDEPPTEDATNYRKMILDYYEDNNYGVTGVNGKAHEVPPPIPAKQKGAGSTFPTGFFEQFYLLSRRGFKQHILEVVPQLIIFLMIAGLSSIVWWQRGYKESDIGDRIGLIFFIALHIFVMPIFSSMAIMINEKLIVRKERSAGMYRLSAYFLSRSVSNIPLDLITPVIFSCILYWTTNLNDKAERFFIFLALCFLGQLVGQSLGLVFGAFFDKQESASPMIMVFFFLSTLMGGFYIGIDNIPSWFRWTQYISIIKYLMDGLVINEFDDPDHAFKLKKPYPGEPPYRTGQEVLDGRALIFDDIWPYALILVGIYFSAQVLAYWILRRSTAGK
eukprot:TRINITY_DN16354_c0_g1_i1.p1 TRINITY_DN16354_c0_g1~~TRINITY_DN16354_c0_g1_i1.p1  ORF type:complete len:701 (+),score=189.33 TRINITY_DN16354_c0_g1_i1:236-2338(+)